MVLKVQKRELTGKKVKHLRTEGSIPASLYGPGIKNETLLVPAKEFKKIFKEAGYSTLIELQHGDTSSQVLIKEVQVHPVRREILHVSLYEVNMKKEITTVIPIHVIGESIAVKNNIGLLITPTPTVTVTCLPADLPSNIEAEISGLTDIGHSITFKDLKLPKGVELASGMAPDTVVAYIATPQKATVEEETPAEGTEAAPAEGEAAAEGAEAKPGDAKEEKKEKKDK